LQTTAGIVQNFVCAGATSREQWDSLVSSYPQLLDELKTLKNKLEAMGKSDAQVSKV
jgi:hypothetical protein